MNNKFNLKNIFWPCVALSFSVAALANGGMTHDHAAMGHAHHSGGVQLTGGLAPHQHQAGEWMFGLSYETRDFSGIHSGSETVTASDLADAGFTRYASTMRMEMAMLHMMFGVTDHVTLMVMPHYMQMEMDMLPTTMMAHMGSGHMGSSHMGHGAHGMMPHTMSVSGWGDTRVGAQFKMCADAKTQVYTNLSLSVPTGSVTRKQAGGVFLPYGMQLGSGTWDVLPGVVMTHAVDHHVLMGGRLGARLPLESQNDSGYSLGDTYHAETWMGVNIAPSVSGSFRLMYEKRNRISGHFNAPHNHASPTDFVVNYGGEFVDLGVGLHVNSGVSGLQLGAEWVVPLAEHYNGFQIGRDQGVQFNVSWAL